MQDEPLTLAQDNLQRMNMSYQQALESVDTGEMQSQLQEAVRYGEQGRDQIEEVLDSTDEERIILHAEQALDGVEEALDQANQALFASETSMREHVEQMGPFIQQAMTQLDAATEIEVM